MKSFKFIVLDFLTAIYADKYEQFNKAFELYKKTPGKNIGLETKLNRVGFTDEFLQSLLYDLQQLNGITDLEIAEEKVSGMKGKSSPELIDVEFDQVEATPKVGEFTPEIGELDEKGELLVFEHEKTFEEKTLREEFPFLNDANCPEVMYVVVGKRIAAFKRYQELHEKLQQVDSAEPQATEEEKAQLVQETEKAYSENQALWIELNHYASTGEILGKHELFKQHVLKREVEEMNKEELVKFISSSATFFSRKKAELGKAKEADKIAKIQTAIDEREYKLKLVNEKLGVGQ